MVFRGAAAQSAAIQRRQRNQLHRLEIFTIGDPSVDLEEKMRIAGKFVRSSRTQVGDGLPGRYWDRHQSKVKTEVCNREDIMVRNILAESSTVSAVLKFARFTVAPCESEHAKHRQAGQAKDQPVSFSRLAATSVNRQLGETGLLQLQGMQGDRLAAETRLRSTPELSVVTLWVLSGDVPKKHSMGLESERRVPHSCIALIGFLTSCRKTRTSILLVQQLGQSVGALGIVFVQR